MTPALLKMLAIAIQAREPVVAWGPPGTGKTEIMNDIGRQIGAHVETVIASIHPPEDFSGLPIAEDKMVFWAPPGWAKRLQEKPRSILFLDEISCAPPTVQAALLRVVRERVIGELALPPTVSVVAAANPPETAAGGWDMSAPMANRFAHLNWALDTNAWCEGMFDGGHFAIPSVPKLPEDWEQHCPNRYTLAASYVKFKGDDALLSVPTQAAAMSKAWPSPRSWVMASRLWAACDSVNAGKDIARGLIAACIGEGLTNELMKYVEELHLPDPEFLLENPGRFTLPQRDDQIYVLLGGVVNAVARQPTQQRWINAWKILGRVADEKSVDVGVFAAKALYRHKPKDIAPTALPSKDLLKYSRVLLLGGVGQNGH